MARTAKDPSKKQPATVEHVMAAIIQGNFEELDKKRHVTFSIAKKAVDLLKGAGSKVKIPDALSAKMAELEASGRSGGLKGKAPPMVGETRTYQIQNYNAKQNKPTSPMVVVPLGVLGEKTKEENAQVKISFDKKQITITLA